MLESTFLFPHRKRLPHRRFASEFEHRDAVIVARDAEQLGDRTVAIGEDMLRIASQMPREIAARPKHRAMLFLPMTREVFGAEVGLGLDADYEVSQDWTRGVEGTGG